MVGEASTAEPRAWMVAVTPFGLVRSSYGACVMTFPVSCGAKLPWGAVAKGKIGIAVRVDRPGTRSGDGAVACSIPHLRGVRGEGAFQVRGVRAGKVLVRG